MTQRNTFGDQKALRETLERFVTSKVFLRYHEAYADPIDKRTILQQSGLLQALHKLAPNLCFRRVPLQRALLNLADSKKFKFQDHAERIQWSEVQGKRIRVLCRHLQQSWLKARGSSSSWVRLVIAPHAPQAAGTDLEELRGQRPPCISSAHPQWQNAVGRKSRSFPAILGDQSISQVMHNCRHAILKSCFHDHL